VTEQEWLRSLEPQELADFLAHHHGGSKRKFQLFLCGCVRRLWPILTRGPFRLAVELSEQAADGLVTDQHIQDISLDWFDDPDFGEGGDAGIAALATTGVWARWDWEDAHDYAAGAAPDGPVSEREIQAGLMRCICGNPFRRVSLRRVWLTPPVLDLARVVYEERVMPSGELDTGRLAVLSDALEEAGCDNEDILGHLRSPGPHVRGCWVVDLLLGKE
jgi:hypothetical protein